MNSLSVLLTDGRAGVHQYWWVSPEPLAGEWQRLRPRPHGLGEGLDSGRPGLEASFKASLEAIHLSQHILLPTAFMRIEGTRLGLCHGSVVSPRVLEPSGLGSNLCPNISRWGPWDKSFIVVLFFHIENK